MRILRFLLLFLVLLMASCGGSPQSGSSVRPGSVTLVIHWPQTRDIPPNTQSLSFSVVTLIKNDEGVTVEDKPVKQQVVQRPSGQTTSTVILSDLPSVAVRIKVTAHLSTDGTGAALAEGFVDVTVPEGGAVNASIELSGFEPARFQVNLFTADELISDSPASLSNTFGTSAASFGSVSCHLTAAGAPFSGVNVASARFQDFVQFDAPGLFGQPLQGTAVFSVTRQVGANTDVIVSGFSDQNLSAGSEVKVPLNLNHPFGAASLIFLLVSAHRTEGTETTDLSITFLRFEGLPPGTTVHSLSGNSWANVP